MTVINTDTSMATEIYNGKKVQGHPLPPQIQKKTIWDTIPGPQQRCMEGKIQLFYHYLSNIGPTCKVLRKIG